MAPIERSITLLGGRNVTSETLYGVGDPRYK